MEKIPFGKFGFINRTAVIWMQSHLSTIVCGVVIVIGATIWGVYQRNAGSPRDYLTAEKLFNQWSGTGNEQLIKLKKLLKQHPELHAKYDGRIAQKLLLSSQQGLAATFSKAALKRVGDFSPHYAQFSECSLLIGEKKLQEALDRSKNLKQTLDQDHQFWTPKSELIKHGQMLYGYNLLRIAFLEQALDNPLGELEAWKAFKQEAGWLESEPLPTRADPNAYELISQNFQKNDVSLKDFIQYREQVLKELL